MSEMTEADKILLKHLSSALFHLEQARYEIRNLDIDDLLSNAYFDLDGVISTLELAKEEIGNDN